MRSGFSTRYNYLLYIDAFPAPTFRHFAARSSAATQTENDSLGDTLIENLFMSIKRYQLFIINNLDLLEFYLIWCSSLILSPPGKDFSF